MPPPLNFDSPKFVCRARGAISRRVAAAAKCESAAIDIGYLLNLFLIFCEISGPLSHAAYRKVHDRGPLN